MDERPRRDQILDRCLDYLLEHGIAGLSLRPLAARAGTSARLLVYHFGSKEQLLIAAMGELRARIQRSFEATTKKAARRHDSPLQQFWAWVTVPTHLQYVKLLFEVQVLALHKPDVYRSYLDDTSSSWVASIESALPPAARNPARATLYAAVVDGLILELLSTGDKRRTTAALKLFDEQQHRRTR
jgi:AcrR family transcriptional regulator